MDPLTVAIIVLILLAFALLDELEDDEGEELDPLTLARPSVERLDAEAARALEELRQLGREERR